MQILESQNTNRPRVLLSVAMSIDGYIDDESSNRLVLSNEEDLDEIDSLRADQDAILVGAGTLRSDNPRLMIHSESRKEKRVSAGKSADLIKVSLTSSGDLSSSLKFFQTGLCQKILYCPESAKETLAAQLPGLVELVSFSQAKVDLHFLLSDLYQRGIAKLIVEGGQQIHSLFLQSGLFDELRLAIAPFFIGQSLAPRFVGPGTFPNSANNRLELVSSRQLGDMAVQTYRNQCRNI